MFNCWHSGNSLVDLAGSSEGGCRAWWERWNLCFRYMRTWLSLRLAPPRTWHRVFFIVMSRQHHHNTRGRRVNYVAMNGGNGEVEDSQDELLEEQEPPSDWEDHGASDSAAVQSGFTSSMAAQHSAAAPLGRASLLEMDDAELDRRGCRGWEHPLGTWGGEGPQDSSAGRTGRAESGAAAPHPRGRSSPGTTRATWSASRSWASSTADGEHGRLATRTTCGSPCWGLAAHAELGVGLRFRAGLRSEQSAAAINQAR